MWFAALGPYQASPWSVSFAVRLLEGSPEVLALLARDPFPDAPPLVIRATVREYRFSAPGGAGWWTPGAPRLYLPGVQLKRWGRPGRARQVVSPRWSHVTIL